EEGLQSPNGPNGAQFLSRGQRPISANLRVTLPPECPGGTPENSPAFQRRGTDHNGISPEGMAEYTPALEAPTSLSAVPLGLVPIQMKPGVETPGYSHKSLRDSRKEFNSVRVISLKLALMGRRPGLRCYAPLGLRCHARWG